MIWRVRGTAYPCVLWSKFRYYTTAATYEKISKPLRLLFCGSDAFSIASLRALVTTQHHVPTLIKSIDVIHRPAKRTGRGLRTLTDVPIAGVAQDLNLNTHVIDTFTGWSPPSTFDLVIAVSFGLFVPPRILSLMKYGGLNVHPSLLPNLRGPAPIAHAILQRHKHTGVSVQTLHPQQFDCGTILAQTPPPGIPISDAMTAIDLEPQLADVGAGMLIEVLKEQKFVPPLQPVPHIVVNGAPLLHAPKLGKEHSFIDFAGQSMDHILVTHRALGDVWSVLPNGDRVIIHHLEESDAENTGFLSPGIFKRKSAKYPCFISKCGRVGNILESTYAGKKPGCGNDKLMHMFKEEGHD